MTPRTRVTSSAETQKSGAETARKVLQVLMEFSRRRPIATVREISEASQLSLPTTHRYVAVLRELGFLEEAERGSHYQLGWRILELAQTARGFVRAALSLDAVQDQANDLLFEHVVKGRFHPAVVAESLRPMIDELLDTMTSADWQLVADELIADARDAIGEPEERQ